MYFADCKGKPWPLCCYIIIEHNFLNLIRIHRFPGQYLTLIYMLQWRLRVDHPVLQQELCFHLRWFHF
jgi:hypothetical protein